MSMKRLIATALASLAVFGVAENRSAKASEEVSELMMSRLLRADAILFATVTRLSRVTDSGNLVSVQLDSVVTVNSRFTDPVSLLRVRGTLSEDRNAALMVRIGQAGVLRQGKRYLILLRGGSWRVAPLLSGGENMLEVRTDSVVGCGSGQVFGIDDYGFVCSTSERQAAPPLTEAALADLLLRRIRRAEQQRPELAIHYNETAQPLQLEPLDEAK
jgi:hypothetical protein